MGISGVLDTNVITNAEQSRELIGYYLSHTNEMSLKGELLISRCFFGFGLYTNAIELARQYLNVYSNDFRAWNMLGTSYMMVKSPDEAVKAFTNAVQLGYKKSYTALAGAALQSGQWDVVQSIIPQLMALQESKDLSQDDKLDLVVILLGYSIKTEDKEIFVNELNGVDAKQILSRDDLKQLVTFGCQSFHGKDIDKIRQEMDAAGKSEAKSPE